MIPKISIITVCYNSSATIERTIKSVLNQTYDNYEYIIVDGKSKDNTLQIVHKYKDDFQGRMKVISEPDNGIYDAMNKGISMATGEIVGLINSDDWYENDTLELVLTAFAENNIDIVYGRMNTFKGERLFSTICYYDEFLNENMINHPTCFIRKEVYLEDGMFDLSYKSAADYELMLRLQSKHRVFHPIDAVLANFRYGGFSNVDNSNYKSVLEKNVIQYKYQVISKGKFFALKLEYFLKGLIKKMYIRKR